MVKKYIVCKKCGCKLERFFCDNCGTIDTFIFQIHLDFILEGMEEIDKLKLLKSLRGVIYEFGKAKTAIGRAIS